MAMVDASAVDIGVTPEVNIVEVDGYKHSIDELQMQVDKLEKRVNEVQHFYLTTGERQLITLKDQSAQKAKNKDKHIPSIKRQQQDASHRDAAASKRMQELMRQFGTIFRQITQHKWAWPFMQPVDVDGLGLHDYYEVIDRPMDFSTIKNQMEANDGTGYKHVQEIYADMLLVFNNAMKYNDETSEVHAMAKTLLEKFEEKWQLLLLKVLEEDKRREEEKVQAQLKKQLAQEAAHARLARDLTNELYDANKRLDELRENVVQKCRRISVKEKRHIGQALTQLCPEDLVKALEIVSQDNPTFQAIGEEIDLDISTQSEFTLWRLKFFVKDALDARGKNSSIGGKNTTSNSHPAATDTSITVSKRKRNALPKAAKRQGKNLSSE